MKEEIMKFFKGDIADDDNTLLAYSHDASLFEVRPKLVLFAKDSLDIQNLVKWAGEAKSRYSDLSITVRAAGTCMSGGPLNHSIILDTNKYMNAIKSVRKVDPYMIKPLFPGSVPVEIVGEAIVEPGCFYRDFEASTLKQELLLPCFTASKSINAVGGMVGNNSAGELTLRYGKTEDYVSQLKIVLADGNEYTVKPLTESEFQLKITQKDFEGNLYRSLYDLLRKNQELLENAKPNVSKNSAGYYLWNILGKNQNGETMFDVCKLIVGSQGTLGIVTEITFRLIETPKNMKLAVVFLKDSKNLGKIVDEILLSHPISVESYDDKTFKLGVRFFRDFVHAKGVWGALRFGLSFMPEFAMNLFGGIPALILLVEYDGKTPGEVDAKCKALKTSLAAFPVKIHITKNPRESEKYWTFRRDSFALLRKHVAHMRTAPFIDDIIVNPEFLPDFLPKINALVQQYPDLTYTIAGHAANGNFHIIPLVPEHDTDLKVTVLELSKKVYDLVLSYKGSITAEHNDGIIRTPFLRQMYGETICALFEATKKIFDPSTLFNPGKKVGGTEADLVNAFKP